MSKYRPDGYDPARARARALAHADTRTRIGNAASGSAVAASGAAASGAAASDARAETYCVYHLCGTCNPKAACKHYHLSSVHHTQKLKQTAKVWALARKYFRAFSVKHREEKAVQQAAENAARANAEMLPLFDAINGVSDGVAADDHSDDDIVVTDVGRKTIMVCQYHVDGKCSEKCPHNRLHLEAYPDELKIVAKVWIHSHGVLCAHAAEHFKKASASASGSASGSASAAATASAEAADAAKKAAIAEKAANTEVGKLLIQMQFEDLAVPFYEKLMIRTIEQLKKQRNDLEARFVLLEQKHSIEISSDVAGYIRDALEELDASASAGAKTDA